MLFLLANFSVFFAKIGAKCTDLPEAKSFFFIPPWWQYIKTGEEDAFGRCVPSFVGADGKFNLLDVMPIGLAIIDILLRIAGFVAVISIMWAGVMYLTASGNPEKASEARHRIYNSLIGLGIAVVAAAAVAFIGNSLT